MGFTLPFYKGMMWDKIIKDPDCIFRKSPVARIRLIVKITEQMRQLQEINLCHGDLHFENILIDVDNEDQDLFDPKFEVKVIDFGNAFLMEEGEGVSHGLTGWTSLIPPEV